MQNKPIICEIHFRVTEGEAFVVGLSNKLTVLSLKWMPRSLMTTTARLLMSRGWWI